MKNIEVGSEVAVRINAGNVKIGDNPHYGEIVQGTVIAVDPCCTKMRRGFGEKKTSPPDYLRAERGQGYAVATTYWVFDPEGKETLKGYVVVSYTSTKFSLTPNKFEIKAVRKQDVLGAWAEHRALRAAIEAKENAEASLDAKRTKWDKVGFAVLVDEVQRRGGGITMIRDEDDGYLKIRIDDMLKILGVLSSPRP